MRLFEAIRRNPWISVPTGGSLLLALWFFLTADPPSLFLRATVSLAPSSPRKAADPAQDQPAVPPMPRKPRTGGKPKGENGTDHHAEGRTIPAQTTVLTDGTVAPGTLVPSTSTDAANRTSSPPMFIMTVSITVRCRADSNKFCNQQLEWLAFPAESEPRIKSPWAADDVMTEDISQGNTKKYRIKFPHPLAGAETVTASAFFKKTKLTWAEIQLSTLEHIDIIKTRAKCEFMDSHVPDDYDGRLLSEFTCTESPTLLDRLKEALPHLSTKG